MVKSPNIDKINQNIQHALEATAKEIRTEAILNLRDTQLSETQKQKLIASLKVHSDLAGHAFYIVSEDEDATALEFGTQQKNATPWLRPALQTVIPKLRQALRKILHPAGQ